MSSPGVRTPVYPGSAAVQTPFKPVSILSVDKVKSTCLVRDNFGVMMTIRCDIMRAKGNLPEPGEQWIIDRQYGDWVLGAIMTGGTTGVTVPQENVHGLPEIITAYDDRMTGIADDAQAQSTAVNTRVDTTNANVSSLEARSIGLVTAKGDLLAGTAAGTVARLPVGGVNTVLTPDSSTPTGLAYKIGLTLITPVPDAAVYVRYVGGTVTGSPVAGTYLAGDWITTQSGFQWICTVGGTPGTWRCPANEALVMNNTQNTRLDTLEAARTKNETIWKNTFYQNGGVVAANNTPVKATGYTTWVNHGGITRTGGDFTFTKAGRWALGFTADSDGADFGTFSSYLQFGTPNPLGPGGLQLGVRNYRASGFSGAGVLSQVATWSGWVEANALNIAFNLWFVWNAPAPAGSASVNYRVWAEYLGPL